MFSRFTKFAIGAALLAAASTQANAQLVRVARNCWDNNAMTTMNPDAIACSGAWSGNMNNQTAAVIAQLNGDWGGAFALSGYSNDANNGPFTGNPQTGTGTLNFDTPIVGRFVLALKAGNQFSLYLFNGTGNGISSIGFTNTGVGIGGGPGLPQDLSHAALYRDTQDRELTVQTVTPEPGTYALMGAGLLGLGVAARRKRQA